MHNSILERADEEFLRKRLGLYCNFNLADGVPKVNGVFSLHLREAAQLERTLYGTTNQSFAGLKDFMGVAQETTSGKIIEWSARTNYLPLLSAGQKPIFANDADCLRGVEREDFDPRREVYLPLEARLLVSTTNAGHTRIVRSRIGSQEIVAEVDFEKTALLVIAQSHYSAWRANVDGARSPLLRANQAFQAVEVPAGRHEVRLVYEDRRFYFGAAVSLPCWIGCGAAWFRWRKREDKPAGEAGKDGPS